MSNKHLRICEIPGTIAISGDMHDLAAHQHHALQVILNPCSEDVIEVEGKVISHRSVIIDAEVAHRYHSVNGLVLLVSPESHLGEALKSRYLNGSPFAYFDVDLPDPLRMEFVIARLLKQLALPACGQFHGEQRLSKLLHQLQIQISEGNIDEINIQWACQQVSLSESRFMHLFKHEVGIAWRPFLLWQRLLCAIRHVKQGASLTQAALSAGFSDSAHLSRTFKANFGMAPSLVMNNSRFIQARDLAEE